MYRAELSRLVSANVLVIDDNPSNVLLLQKILLMHGYENVKTLTDSRQVFDSIITYQPDIVLLDLQMPHIDGYSILEWIRSEKTTCFLPVIVITAQNDNVTKLKALSMGAQDFIGKPFDHMEVITRIGNLLQIRRLHNLLQENNEQLERRVEARTKEIKDLQMELIERLMRATEFRDENTGNHIARIGAHARFLAQKLGFSEVEAADIFAASKMHDIGKVGIPDEILQKTENLSPEEMEQMKKHTIIGAKILSGSNYEMIRIAEQIALTHHEKWDGSGYPQGLKGREIPLVGRITALVDVFDALTSSRAYKDAWTLEQATTYIKDQSGQYFDPDLTKVFLDTLDEFMLLIQ